jgi:predicted Fe-S protein YdhL (DUF1289 family)
MPPGAIDWRQLAACEQLLAALAGRKDEALPPGRNLPYMRHMPAAEPSSPCVKICIVDPISALCIGCGRTLAEIAAWPQMGEAERAAVMAGLEARLIASRSRARRGGKVRASGRDR